MQTDFTYHLAIVAKTARDGSISLQTNAALDKEQAYHYPNLRALILDAKDRFGVTLNYSKVYRDVSSQGLAAVVLDAKPCVQRAGGSHLYRDKMVLLISRTARPRGGVFEPSVR